MPRDAPLERFGVRGRWKEGGRVLEFATCPHEITRRKGTECLSISRGLCRETKDIVTALERRDFARPLTQ